jgi:predicted PurR-regulated permease PerM
VADERSKVQKRTFGVLLAIASLLFLWTLSPIWVPIFLGVLLSVVASPLMRRLMPRTHHPRLLAAGITALTLAVGMGLVLVVGVVVIRELIRFLTGPGRDWLERGADWLNSPHAARALARLGETPDQVKETLRSYGQGLTTHLTELLTGLVAATSSGVLTIVFTATTLYYVLLEGHALVELLERLVPLPRDESRALVREFRDALVGTVVGIAVIGAFQAVATWLGLVAFGVPRAPVWGAATGVASLVPIFGTALVCVPVGVHQIVTGHVGSGIGFLVYWALVVVGVADYILRPREMRGHLRMHELLVLISIFGGLEAFGPLGLALGPLFVALFVALVRIYERDYRPTLRAQPH